jgi:hypothetical protein
MSGKKYQIFISSTFKDLVEARETVTKSILDMYHIPIGMEMFSADNNEQWDTIKTTIDNSDFYVLIIGHRYGSTTREGISYTEKEHDYAKEIGVPILTFIRNRDSATTPEQRDREASKKKKLESFISKVSSDAMINFWNEQSDLALKISIALTKAFAKYNRTGWIRANEGMSPKVGEEMAVLSKENRELKNRIIELEKKQSSRSPFFEILINSQKDLEIKYIADSELETVSNLYLKKITEAPYDVRPYINSNLLIRYNNIIESNGTEVAEYNTNVILYERHKRTHVPFYLTFKNIGKSKATNVVLEIEFPNSLYISKNKRDVPSIDLTKPEKLPRNPIDEASALKRKQDELRSSFFLGTVGNYSSDDEIFNRNYSIDENNFRAKFNHILHTQMESTEEILLTPLGRGAYDITVSIICEEFDEPQICYLNVNVQ